MRLQIGEDEERGLTEKCKRKELTLEKEDEGK